MGKWAFISLTQTGLEKCVEVRDKLNVSGDILTIDKRKKNFVDGVFNSFTNLMAHAFQQYSVLVCVMAAGIVVRTMAHLLESKLTDPAVLVMDEKGEFCISLLSGHIGKANDYAREIERQTGARAVITTASDVSGKIAVDTLAQQLNCEIDNMTKAKDITAMIVNNEKVMINQAVTGLPENVVVDQIENQDQYNGLIIVSSNRLRGEQLTKPHVQLIPKNVIVGVGCRRGVEKERILNAINKALKQFNRNRVAVKLIATVDIKKDEKGIFEAATDLGIGVEIISREEIRKVEDQFNGSSFVKETIGVSCVAEPCGYIASNGGKQLCERMKDNGVAVSLWEE